MLLSLQVNAVMTMKRYRKGADKERRLKKKLEKEGFWVVRAAGSKGIADLVAIKNSRAYLIQVKHERISKLEATKLKEIAASCGAFPIVALYKRKLRRFVFIDLRDEGDEQNDGTNPPTTGTKDHDG